MQCQLDGMCVSSPDNAQAPEVGEFGEEWPGNVAVESPGSSNVEQGQKEEECVEEELEKGSGQLGEEGKVVSEKGYDGHDGAFEVARIRSEEQTVIYLTFSRDCRGRQCGRFPWCDVPSTELRARACTLRSGERKKNARGEKGRRLMSRGREILSYQRRRENHDRERSNDKTIACARLARKGYNNGRLQSCAGRVAA